MSGELLYKKLTNREDLKDIPLTTLLYVTMAVLEEIDNCLELENIYDAL